MANIFRTYIKEFEEADLESAIQLDVQVTDIIARDIRLDDQDILI